MTMYDIPQKNLAEFFESMFGNMPQKLIHELIWRLN